MGKIKDKVFGLVVSKNVTNSLADSIKDNNQAKFYLAQTDKTSGVPLDDVTNPNELTDRNVLIINGNKIQGVNQSDLNKLDAIEDATKLFVYKGSISPNDFKALSAYDVVKGDVYNVTGECEVNHVKYPAFTNFICINVTQLGPQAATIEWDSLGGTMQIGAKARKTINSNGDTIEFNTPGNIPINNFSLVVSTNEGLYISTMNNIGLNFKEPDTIFFNNTNNRYHGLTYERKPYSIIDQISIQVDAPLSISTFGKIELEIGTGLAKNLNSLYISLAANKSEPIINNSYAENSGLSYNQYGELTVAIGEPNSNNGDCIDNALVLGTGNNKDYHGGLCISSSVMVDFIKINMNIRNYINSLIDAKLQAQ